ncbi:hypothetical protein EJ08DRAFT_483438 [Tothia fuscella]|uniref:Uncharacterized protein n=1 Tax=Tothia fuscella TaxID=1048955 RepID=A0A9P4TTC5_9PEZI|nr:hypothetical protein EJ08DRAFT_483438 [Tothia fuscella]
MASALFGLGLKQLGKAVGQKVAEAAGNELLGLIVGNMLDATDQKLAAIQEAISVLSTKLDRLSEDLADFRFDAQSQWGIEHIAKIETLFDEYSRGLLELSKCTKNRDAKREGATETEFERAKRSLINTGNRVKDNVPTSLLRIHYSLVGEASSRGLFELARAADLKKSKGFLNHYIYMRQLFLRYWTVSMKGVTLLQWISHKNSGVDFYGADSGKTKGPITAACDRMMKQQDDFVKLIGVNIIALASTILQYPPGGELVTIYSEDGSDWDSQHAGVVWSQKGDILFSDYESPMGLSHELHKFHANELMPIFMKHTDERDPTAKCEWKIWAIGTDKKTVFSVAGDYKFEISVWPDEPERYLQFGDPSDAAQEFVVTAPANKHQSVWRIFCNEQSDYLSFQYAYDGFPENGWWIYCEPERIRRNRNGNFTSYSALVRSIDRHPEDARERFKLGGHTWEGNPNNKVPF